MRPFWEVIASTVLAAIFIFGGILVLRLAAVVPTEGPIDQALQYTALVLSAFTVLVGLVLLWEAFFGTWARGVLPSPAADDDSA